MCTARCRVKDQYLKFSPESHILYFIKVFFYKEHSKLPRKIKIRSPVKKMFWILNCKELHTVCRKCFKSPQTFIFFWSPPFQHVRLEVSSQQKETLLPTSPLCHHVSLCLGSTFLYLLKSNINISCWVIHFSPRKITSFGFFLPKNMSEFLIDQTHKRLGDLLSSWRVYSLLSCS